MTLGFCNERSWDGLGRADRIHSVGKEDVEDKCSTLATEAGPLRKVFSIRKLDVCERSFERYVAAR